MTQVYNIPVTRAFDNLGKVAVGYQKFFYDTGTTTKRSIFADSALTTPLTNPIISDSNGYFPQIFMQGTGDDYKAVFTDNTDGDPPTSPIWTADPVEVDANDINAFGTRPAQHWGTTTNTATEYEISPVTPISSYDSDLLFSIEVHITNTGAATLAAEDGADLGNFLTALDIKKYDGAGGKVDIEAGDLQGNQTYLVRIDIVDAVVLNPEIREKATFNTAIVNKLTIPVNAELIIATGSITPTDSQHTVDTEADAATDDLDTIAIANLPAGTTIILSIEDSARNVVIKSGTGNIITSNAQDIILDVTNDRFVGLSDGTNIIEISRTLAAEPISNKRLFASATISNDTTVDFTDIFVAGFNYEAEVTNLQPASDSNLDLRVRTTTVFQTANYRGILINASTADTVSSVNTGTVNIGLTNFIIDSATTKGYSGRIWFPNPANTGTHKQVEHKGSHDNSSGNYSVVHGAGSYEGSTLAVNGFQLFMSTGNVLTGTIKVFATPI